MDGAGDGRIIGPMQYVIDMTAGEAMLFAALLAAHGGHIGTDTINSASAMLAAAGLGGE